MSHGGGVCVDQRLHVLSVSVCKHTQQQRLKQEEGTVEAERRREREEAQHQRVQVTTQC